MQDQDQLQQFPSITQQQIPQQQQGEELLKAKSEKKYHRRKKTDINDKPYKCGCKKEFNDYSSLYTHIKTNHDLQIPEKTVLPQLKKKDVMQFLKEQKGDPVQTDEFDIEISQFILFYLDQEDLLATFLKFEDSIDKSQKDNTISEFFHAEDKHFFVIDELDKAKKQDYGTLLNDQNALALSQEYLKPFTKESASEILYLIEHILKQMKIQEQKYQQENNNQIPFQYNYAEIIEETKKFYQQKLPSFTTLPKLKQTEFLVYIQDFAINFCKSLQNLLNNPQLMIYTQQQQQSQNIIQQNPHKQSIQQIQQQTQSQKQSSNNLESRKSSLESQPLKKLKTQSSNNINIPPTTTAQQQQQNNLNNIQQQYNLLLNNPLNNINIANLLPQQNQFPQLQQFDPTYIEQASAFIPTQPYTDQLYINNGNNNTNNIDINNNPNNFEDQLQLQQQQQQNQQQHQ